MLQYRFELEIYCTVHYSTEDYSIYTYWTYVQNVRNVINFLQFKGLQHYNKNYYRCFPHKFAVLVCVDGGQGSILTTNT